MTTLRVLLPLTVFLAVTSDVDTGCVLSKGCVYNGVQIAEGQSFQNDDCQDCQCSNGNIGCCGNGQVIVHVDERCEIIQMTKCNQMAVLKGGEGKPCPYGYAAVPT